MRKLLDLQHDLDKRTQQRKEYRKQTVAKKQATSKLVSDLLSGRKVYIAQNADTYGLEKYYELKQVDTLPNGDLVLHAGYDKTDEVKPRYEE